MPDAVFTSPAEAAYALAMLDYVSPVTWDDHLAVASAYFVTGRNELAMTHAKRALALSRNPHTLLNLGMTLEVESRWQESLPLAEEAYRLAPSDRRIQCWYSDSMLRMGRFAEAWSCYADSHADWAGMRNVLPEWNGHDFLDGKRILVLPAGGYGDDILHLRWLPLLSAMGATVTLVCPESFQPLLAGVPYIHHFVTGSVREPIVDIHLAEYDLFTSLRALPTHFCPTVKDIPAKPYLTYEITYQQATAWNAPIGLCTRAGEKNFPRPHRSLTAAQSYRLRNIIGGDCEELNISRGGWDVTRNRIAGLRLVVTVDTGIAHLAGAMGIRTFLMLPGISASYWGISGDACAFYPSVRLFRNDAEGIDNSVNKVITTLTSGEI